MRPRNSKKPGKEAKQPWLFRRGGCDRALVCLAVNGPLTVRELARATKTDSHKMWDIVERLRACGLVVKRNRCGGRKYVAINRRLPIYRALMRLLLALDRYWPARRDGLNTARWHMPFNSNLSGHRTDLIFQSPVRSRILLFVAAVGTTDMITMYGTLGINSVSALLAVNHWVKQGVLRSQRFKRHRLISLNPDFIAAKELRALLAAIIARSKEYRGLRTAVREKLRAVLRESREMQ